MVLDLSHRRVGSRPWRPPGTGSSLMGANDRSSQPCGCDPGADWLCSLHQYAHDAVVNERARLSALVRQLPGLQTATVAHPNWVNRDDVLALLKDA